MKRIFDVQLLLRSVYRRSKLAKRIIFFLRAPRLRRMARLKALPFNGDRIILEAMRSLIGCGVSFFVETGTYLGHSSGYIAGEYPELKVFTIENNDNYFDASSRVLKRYPNIRTVRGDSAEEIKKIIGSELRDAQALFFLDAHWHDFFPLPEEIRSISAGTSKAIILIHDFQVPGRDEFGFDVYQGKAIGMDVLLDNLNKAGKYSIFLPAYDYFSAFNQCGSDPKKLRGCAIIFLNADEACLKFRQNPVSKRFKLYK